MGRFDSRFRILYLIFSHNKTGSLFPKESVSSEPNVYGTIQKGNRKDDNSAAIEVFPYVLHYHPVLILIRVGGDTRSHRNAGSNTPVRRIVFQRKYKYMLNNWEPS